MHRKVEQTEENVSANGTVNGTVNVADLATALQVTEKTIRREIYFLRDIGLIHRIGSDKTGHWEVVNNEES